MTIRAWLPQDTAVFGQLPSNVVADVYNGVDEPPASLDEVEFYVMPYVYQSAPAELMSHMPALRVVQALTAGVDNIAPHVPAGVTLCNARGVHDPSTAELAVTLILSSLRGIPEFVEAQQAGTWTPLRRPALAGKTVMIVGYGSIGQAIAARLRPFEANIIPVARTARDGVVSIADLHQHLPTADVVVLMVPGTPETRSMVNAEFLAQLRDGALLVNVARGPVVDTDALVAELKTQRIHAALDVVHPEPLPPGHPLWTSPNLLLTPHVAGNTDQLLPRIAELVASQLANYAAGAPLRNIVTGEY